MVPLSTTACEYPNCREAATVVVVIELGRFVGRSSVEVSLCGAHAEHAQAIARLYDGIAYRLRPA